ncbi:MAG: hypothetical protein V2A56_11160 [bacterium]
MNRILLILVAVVVIIIVILSIGNRHNDSSVVEAKGFHLDSTGFKTPESVFYDSDADLYLVSNINGSPTDMDDNGFISRVNPDGSISELKWIDGADENVTLSAPKGMAVAGEVLYVSDINALRLFDKQSGEPVGAVKIPGSTFLNDVVADGQGGVYVSDSGLNPDFSASGTDAVYHVLADWSVETVAKGKELMRPNGLAMVDGTLLCITFGGKSLLKIGMDGTISTEAELPGGSLDGIEQAKDGRLLISSWETKTVYAVDGEGTATALVTDVESPADIGYDGKRNLVLIPLFSLDAISVVPVGQ